MDPRKLTPPLPLLDTFQHPVEVSFSLRKRVTQGLMVINGSQDLRFPSWLRITMKRISAQFTKIFGQREGIIFEISKKSLNEANATINLISKSNAQEYMPDLLIGFGQMGAGNSSFVNLKN